jgi:RHS repeat-associated protein
VRDAIVQNGDPQGRIVMRYDYDMLGNRIHQASMEASARWMLNDVTGKPICAWDSRGHTFRTEYDPLRRPLRSFVIGADPANPNQELLTERLVYGEQHPEDELRNLRGKLYLHLDQAGVVTNEAHDFKGNPLRATRRLARVYKQAVGWSTVNAALPANATAKLNPAALEAALASRLEADTFTSHTAYDALNRLVQVLAPRSNQPGAERNVIQPVYNEANLLERVHVWLGHPNEPTGLLDAATVPPSPVGVSNIDYDAKGQRLRIDYKNGASTQYAYDPETFRLIRLTTTRPANLNGLATQLFKQPATVQGLHYTYDPVGNITQIADEALLTIFHNNEQVEPVCQYNYDAMYRLIEAKGREHIDQLAFLLNPPNGNYRDYPFVGAGQLNNPQAVRNYTEQYGYDPVGNFEQMIHQAANGGWMRNYAYNETSLIEDGTLGTLLKTTNRLSSTTVGNNNPLPERYVYDAHGNMIRIPHLGGAHPGPNMHWDYRDQLRQTDLGGSGTAYDVYDAAGQRVRKVWEKSANLIEERIYLGGFEIYRRRQGAERLERETLHIIDDKQRIALVETRTLDTAGNDPAPQQLIRYQFGNHLGSASLELDDQAQIISYEEYTPYGSTSYQAVRSQTETPKRYRYTGKERDEESGLYYHRSRYYAPWLGRWVSPDPEELHDGPNVFQFVRGNPLKLWDPTGTSSKPAKLNDVVIYNTKISNRKDLGSNIEKDHVISQGKIKIMRTDPKGKVHYNPRQDPAVVVETGKATASQPAKPHTQKTFIDPQADVKEIPRLKQEGIKSISGDIVETSRNAAIRSGMDPTAVDTAIQGQLDNLHSSQTLSQTAAELKALELEALKKVGKAAAVAPKAAALAKGTPKGTGGSVSLGMLGIMLGTTLAGVQMAEGGQSIAEGRTGEGGITIAEGSANLFLTFAPYAKGVTAGAGGTAFLAGIAAAGGVALAADTARAAARGEETPIEGADKFYGTQFSDIYAWQKRSLGARVAFGILTMGGSEAWYNLNKAVE